ncbi:MAG TPA: energy transducer TonB [Sphingomicrobium sp.]
MAARRVWTAAAIASILLPAGAAPAVAEPLAPLKSWVLDYAENQCNASRTYGAANDPIGFALRPAPNGETYELLVGRQHHGPRYAEELKGTVDFGHGPLKAWLLHYGGKGKRIDVYAYRISAAEMAQARSASAVLLTAKEAQSVSFRLDHMGQLLSGLDKCTEDLKHYWNMGEELTGKIAVPSKGDVRTVFSDEDYPSEALMQGKEGSGRFLLLIDEKGSVAGCHVQVPSGVPILDAMGCQVIRERAKFKPALDAQGHPVRSSYFTPPINWRLAS